MKLRYALMGVMFSGGLATCPAAAQDAKPADAPAEAPAPAAPAFPVYGGPLAANPKPLTFDSPVGPVVVSGILTGGALFTQNTVAGDEDSRADIFNGLVTVQTTTGPIQAVVQAGIYSFPSLGYGYLRSDTATDQLYGPVPVAYARIVPTSEITIQAGLMPTIIGWEYGFTYQNQNISRGLLWGQEPVISRAIQVGYVKGKWNAQFSLSDGFFSNKLNWLAANVSYSFNSNNILTVIASGNVGDTAPRNNLATPLAQNNGEIYNIVYTYKTGAWTFTPYLQYTRTHVLPRYGLTQRGETFSGAIIAYRSWTNGLNLGARAEYVASYGKAGAPNLLGYGRGSSAYTFTVTPGVQKGPFFLRADLSYVGLTDIDQGSGFGKNGNKKDQFRGILEAGVLF